MSLGIDILKKIKKSKLKPKAKWIFALQNIIAWSLGILSLMISSVTVSVIINIINNNDYPLFKMMHPSPFNIIIQTLPYFWIIGTIIFIIVFRYTLKQTKDGYKIEIYKIIIISIILNIILGTFFYIIGVGNNIDNSFSRRSPFYNQIMKPRDMMWLQENQGMITGQIISLTDQNNFKLEDLNKKIWNIIVSKDKMSKPKFERIPPPPRIILKLNSKIRALGEKINENTFQAFIIKPAPHNPYHNFPINKEIYPIK